MTTSDYLNLGCGDKFHPEWTNLDMVSRDPLVVAHDLLQGLPFPDASFSVVYHSQLLEHLPRDAALGFLAECRRVLLPDGIIRVVVPDLEDIARTYLQTLDACLQAPGPAEEADYDWMMLELLDQSVRTSSGGDMATYLAQPDIQNEPFVIARTGRSGMDARSYFLGRARTGAIGDGQARRSIGALVRRIATMLPPALRIGRFRLSGEVHQWMYDRHSLGRLLRQAGFQDARVLSATTSQVPDWQRFGLDVRDGIAFDPTSLFMEARA